MITAHINAADISVQDFQFDLGPVVYSPPTIIDRPEGYSLKNHQSVCVLAKSEKFEEFGFSDSVKEYSIEKAKSEALERLIFRAFASTKGQPETSNGWACHFNIHLAIENGIFELIERDVSLSVWQNGGEYIEIPDSLLPAEIVEWKSQRSASLEFSELRIFLADSGNGCAVTAMLFNSKGCFVAGHASRLTLNQAILSAVNECFRAAHSALRFEYFTEVGKLHSDISEVIVPPGTHSVAYAYSNTLPNEIKFRSGNDIEVKSRWNDHIAKYDLLKVSDFKILAMKVNERTVVRVKSTKYREIYWGKKKEERNFKNQKPHIVG